MKRKFSALFATLLAVVMIFAMAITMTACDNGKHVIDETTTVSFHMNSKNKPVATFFCTHCEKEVTVEAKVEDVEKHGPDCENDAYDLYSVSLTLEGITVNGSITVAGSPKLGHHYNDPTIEWPEDMTSKAVIHNTCTAGHEETYERAVTVKIVDEDYPTWNTQGSMRMFCTFEGKEYCSKVLKAPALKDMYEVVDFDASKVHDGELTTLNLALKDGKSFIKDLEDVYPRTTTIEATVKTVQVEAPTCTAAGTLEVYAVMDTNEEMHDLGHVEIPALGHTWKSSERDGWVIEIIRDPSSAFGLSIYYKRDCTVCHLHEERVATVGDDDFAALAASDNNG